MALKVELKSGERFILGNAVITNGGGRACLLIEGDTPILREKNIMRPEATNTPAKHIYLIIQMMYLSTDPARHHGEYFALTGDLVAAAPSTVPFIDRINNLMLTGSYYKALREAEALIAHEEEILANAFSSKGL
ncbi:hypothetical protein MNBD_ALPHA09-711 [hydrothermal vent metagenome]|uniref:Flagellum biosynthesis repressor protein FlbT n=1 Tax=hydrothermal vent metagenome TaxID=652676 RepID=A0A3B0TH16_9ZZZZ